MKKYKSKFNEQLLEENKVNKNTLSDFLLDYWINELSNPQGLSYFPTVLTDALQELIDGSTSGIEIEADDFDRHQKIQDFKNQINDFKKDLIHRINGLKVRA